MSTSFSEAVSAHPLRPFQILTVSLVLAVLVLDGMDAQLLGIVVPLIVEEWGIDRAGFGLALSAALVGMGIGAMLGGWIGDRIGRLNTLFLSAMLFGAATIAASLANDVPTMTVLRVIGGIGFGAAGPNALPLASEWMPARYRTYVITLLSVGIPLGGTVGAVLTPFLLPGQGWRGTFVIFGAVAIGVGVLAILLLRETPTYLLAKGRHERAHRLAHKVIPADVALVHEEAAAAGQVGPAIGVFHASNRRLNWGTSIAFGASTAVVYAVTSWGTELFTAKGFTLDQAIGVIFWVGLFSVIGAVLAGWLLRAFGSRVLLIAAFFIAFAGTVALAIAVEQVTGVPSDMEIAAVYVLGCIVGAVASMGIATLYAVMTLGYPVSCRSSGIGFGMMIGRAGGIVMAFSGGYLLNAGGDSVLPFFAVMAACALIGSSSAWIIDRHVEPAARY